MTALEALKLPPKDKYHENIIETAKRAPGEAEYCTQYSSGACLWELPGGETTIIKPD